mgnify:CR=1 FL=1
MDIASRVMDCLQRKAKTFQERWVEMSDIQRDIVLLSVLIIVLAHLVALVIFNNL